MEEKIISPSLLAANFLDLKTDIEQLNNSDAKWLHLDVMDGNFVPNISFGFDIIKQVRTISNHYFDVHLMIKNPSQYIESVVDAGADLITLHFEIEEDIIEVIDLIKSYGKQVGIAINPDTKIEKIINLLDKIDLILIMSVYPGFGGQTYMNEVEKKILRLHEYKKKTKNKFLIEIDGGINDKTAKRAFECGVDVLVAGSYIFKGDIKEKVSILLNA